MICYKDRAFCGSVTINHTCGREITPEQILDANRIGLLIAYADFCEYDDESTQ